MMFRIISHQGNAYRNTMRTPPHTYQGDCNKKTTLERMWRDWDSHTLLWKCNTVHPLWKAVWQFLKKKVKHNFTIQPRHFSPRNLLKRNENTGAHKDLYVNVYSGIIYNSQKLKKLMFINWSWINKIYYIHTMEYYLLNNKSNKLFNISNNMDNPQK